MWPFAVGATLAVVLVPLVAVLALATIGLPEPEALVAALACVVLSIGTAAIGASMWTRRRESVDVAFGELMLWRFLRRHKAERTIDESAAALGLGPSWDLKDRVIDLDPDRALSVLHRLTTALEAKDPYTHGHSRRVERHVHRTAMAMGLSSDEIKDLRVAAALHDVGKIRVPSQILRKPEALDGHEMVLMREHVHVGAAMVAGAASPEVTAAILHHHECWNGTGYPSGLAQEGIPLSARIITVADTYDALTSARPYKSGCGRREAIEVLRSGAGVQFDPHVVDAFISTLPAALPAVSALLIFVRPERMARRVLSWARSSAIGSVSTGAVAAGSAAAVITAGVIFPTGGGLSIDRRIAPESEAAPVGSVQGSTDDGSTVGSDHRPAEKRSMKADDRSDPRARVASAGSTSDEATDNGSDNSSSPTGDGGRGGRGNGGPPGNGGPNDDGPNDDGQPTTTSPGDGVDDDPGIPSPTPPDDVGGDEDDEGDEDCKEKKGKGHDEHGQGQGHGHDDHCGE
jgi:HD-GYP domain-containing protein (c-di-GMP phosphodiesterase class II)